MTAPLPPRPIELTCQRCHDTFHTHDLSRALSTHRRVCNACRAGWPTDRPKANKHEAANLD